MAMARSRRAFNRPPISKSGLSLIARYFELLRVLDRPLLELVVLLLLLDRPAVRLFELDLERVLPRLLPRLV
jgi:hypothetical protein